MSDETFRRHKTDYCSADGAELVSNGFRLLLPLVQLVVVCTNAAGLLHSAGRRTHHVLHCARARRGTYGCASPLYSGAGCYSAALLPLPVPIARFD